MPIPARAETPVGVLISPPWSTNALNSPIDANSRRISAAPETRLNRRGAARAPVSVSRDDLIAGAGTGGLARRWTRGGDVRNVWFGPDRSGSTLGEGPAAGGGAVLRAMRARAARRLGAAAVVIAAAVADATAQEAISPAIVERVGEAAERDEARRVALEYLGRQVEQVIVRLGEIETQNESLRAEKETLERRLGEVTAAHRSLEQALDTATREKQSELEALQERLAALTAELDGERHLRDALRRERDRLAGRLEATSNAHGALERAFEGSEQRAAKQLADLRHQLAALTVELEDERAVREALARQGDELAETVAALSRERTRLSAALNEAQGTIGEHRSAADRQRSEIDQLSRHVAALRADLKSLKEALAAAQVRAGARTKRSRISAAASTPLWPRVCSSSRGIARSFSAACARRSATARTCASPAIASCCSPSSCSLPVRHRSAQPAGANWSGSAPRSNGSPA